MSKVVPPLAILLVEEVIFGFVDTWFGLIYSLVLLTYLVEQFTNKREGAMMYDGVDGSAF